MDFNNFLAAVQFHIQFNEYSLALLPFYENVVLLIIPNWKRSIGINAPSHCVPGEIPLNNLSIMENLTRRFPAS